MNLTLIAAAVAALVAAAGAYKLTSMSYEANIAKAAQEAQARVDASNRTALNAAASYEGWKATQKPKVITITREVERAVQESHDWSVEPVPASVQHAIAAAAANASASEPDAAVPAVPAASDPDEQRSGTGLRVGPRMGLRLPGAASGAL